MKLGNRDIGPDDLQIERLGECGRDTPLSNVGFVDDHEGVAVEVRRSAIEERLEAGKPLLHLELAGPRTRIFHDPAETTAGIVTCGGLCPGLNDVIRALVRQLEGSYGVRDVLGFRYGYRGLAARNGLEPVRLTSDLVSDIHRDGGTVIGTSRDEQNVDEMIDTLLERDVRVLFAIGGEGTMRGASELCEGIARRGESIGVIGIPKTIDNDIPVIRKSFGFETAVAEAARAINAGHVEARSHPFGVAVVRLMGRDSGFIAAAATIASGDVDFCLVPEAPFALDGERGLFQHLERRLQQRGHAVIVVAEGAGKTLRDEVGEDDIGRILVASIRQSMPRRGIDVIVKYIDPSYLIRSVPATADDSVFCAKLAHTAVHAAMTGRTRMMVGFYNDNFVHVPLHLVTGPRQQLRLDGKLWRGVLESTGQPRVLV